MRALLSIALTSYTMLLLTNLLLAQQCDVKVTAPKAEEWVVEQGDVIGTGKIPDHSFLWILVRRDDQPKKFFWPQQALAAKDVNGSPQWKISVHYGVPADRGHNFKVVAVIVDEATNERLENWREQAPSNDYKPLIGMPSSVAGCDPVEVIVKKSE
jgi:hypothetical protein